MATGSPSLSLLPCGRVQRLEQPSLHLQSFGLASVWFPSGLRRCRRASAFTSGAREHDSGLHLLACASASQRTVYASVRRPENLREIYRLAVGVAGAGECKRVALGGLFLATFGCACDWCDRAGRAQLCCCSWLVPTGGVGVAVRPPTSEFTGRSSSVATAETCHCIRRPRMSSSCSCRTSCRELRGRPAPLSWVSPVAFRSDQPLCGARSRTNHLYKDWVFKRRWCSGTVAYHQFLQGRVLGPAGAHCNGGAGQYPHCSSVELDTANFPVRFQLFLEAHTNRCRRQRPLNGRIFPLAHKHQLQSVCRGANCPG
mmetsp:Transcript_90846/g.243308  ORF Transcript_90846/g.243308 Transcript_90846/m.243308 type:complete len:314 (-) Transcript_90846:403-1344(-)